MTYKICQLELFGRWSHDVAGTEWCKRWRSSKTAKKCRRKERRRGTRERSKTDADVGDDDGLFDNLRRKPFGWDDALWQFEQIYINTSPCKYTMILLPSCAAWAGGRVRIFTILRRPPNTACAKNHLHAWCCRMVYDWNFNHYLK